MMVPVRTEKCPNCQKDGGWLVDYKSYAAIWQCMECRDGNPRDNSLPQKIIPYPLTYGSYEKANGLD